MHGCILAGHRPLGYPIDMTRITADLMIFLAALIWGVAFVFQKTAMDHVGPYLFIAARAMVAALTLFPIALYVQQSTTSAARDIKGLVRIAIIGGLLFFAGAATQQIGLQTATVTNAGFLTGLYVIFTPLVAWGLNRIAPNPLVWPAIVASFLGAWLLGGGSLGSFSRGDAFIALCSIFWSVHVVVTGRASQYANAFLFTALQFTTVAILATVSAFAFETVSFSQLRAAGFEIAYVGVLSSALTFTLLAIAMRHTPPAEAAVIASLEMVVAAIAGAVILGERLGTLGMIGAGLMLAACLLVQAAPILDGRRGRPRTH
jgi:drug/metabolite transporter (DMT)-like permease